jgi:uncharacterized protein (TIGR04255 family)
MSSTKLKNAPLKEVIFELHWNCPIDNTGMQKDEEFEFAQGRFAERIKSSFPVYKKLIPEGFPLNILHAPIHQYWKGEFKWPVSQHGQGIIAINEVEEGYEWENSFKPTVKQVLEVLFSSYEKPLKYERLKLQYIDVWDINDDNPFEFIEKNLQTKVSSNNGSSGILKDINLFQSFELEDKSNLLINISTGVNNKTLCKSIVLSTSVEKQGVFTQKDIFDWTESAHSICSNSFKKMLNKEFYEKLDK